jgi:subtilisin
MRNGPGANVTRLLTAAATALVVMGCTDQQRLLAPEDGTSLSQGQGAGASTVDVIVVLKPGFAPGGWASNRARAARFAEDFGVEARFTYGEVLFGFAGPVPAGRLNALRNHPHVEYVDIDQAVSLPPTIQHHRPDHGNRNDPPAEPEPDPQLVPWGIHRIGTAENGATGRGVSVYILDTGIDAGHADLKGNLGDGYASIACQSGCSAPWDDDHGHGTHVAGTVGAIDNLIDVVGVAPEVTLHAVKVLSANGSGSWSAVIAGIDWVAARDAERVRVINMSLGGGGSKIGDCTATGYEGEPDAIHESLCNAKNAGVVIVAAAGNGSSSAAYFVPAAYYDAVITVSAAECQFEAYTGETCHPGTEGWAMFSNWGVGQDDAWTSRNSLPVLIAAPGFRVASTVRGGGIGWMSGTSMASPHVAGAVAHLVEKGGYASDGSAFAQIRQTLLDNAECTAAWSNKSGSPHTESFLNLGTGSGECADPPPLPPAPEAPTNLDATAISHTEIHLTWQHAEAGEVRFRLSRWDGTGWAYSMLLGPELYYTNRYLPPETTFKYRVQAVRDGVESEWSAEAEATTEVGPPPPPIPGDFQATAISAEAIHLTWTYEEPIPEDVRFQVARKDGDNWINVVVLGSQLSFTNAALAPETSYTYRVRAARDGMASEWSPERTATTHAPATFDATFSYQCEKDRCDFVADHKEPAAYYAWDTDAEEQGSWARTRTFTTAGSHRVALTIREGDRSATSARTVTCESRGRNIFCR